MASPLLSRIKSLISENYAQRNEENEDLRRLKILHQNTKSGIYFPMNKQETPRKYNESQRVF